MWDFSSSDAAKDPRTCKKRLEDLTAVQAKLAKNVNMKAQAMFSKAEREYNDLLKKKKIVEDDKVLQQTANRLPPEIDRVISIPFSSHRPRLKAPSGIWTRRRTRL